MMAVSVAVVGCMLAEIILSIGRWGDNGRSPLYWLLLLVGGDGGDVAEL